MTGLARIDELVARAARLRTAGVRVYVAATGSGLWNPGRPVARARVLVVLRPLRLRRDRRPVGIPSRAVRQRRGGNRSGHGGLRPCGPPRAGIAAIDPLGVTASVATTKEHRGDHRFHVAAGTPNQVAGRTVFLAKGAGAERRRLDGDIADELALQVLFDAAGTARDASLEDWGDRALVRFFERPYWDGNGARLASSAVAEGATLAPGAFDPPHAGHLALARQTADGSSAIFSICANPPHKERLTVGDMLRRARLLQPSGPRWTSSRSRGRDFA